MEIIEFTDLLKGDSLLGQYEKLRNSSLFTDYWTCKEISKTQHSADCLDSVALDIKSECVNAANIFMQEFEKAYSRFIRFNMPFFDKDITTAKGQAFISFFFYFNQVWDYTLHHSPDTKRFTATHPINDDTILLFKIESLKISIQFMNELLIERESDFIIHVVPLLENDEDYLQQNKDRKRIRYAFFNNELPYCWNNYIKAIDYNSEYIKGLSYLQQPVRELTNSNPYPKIFTDVGYSIFEKYKDEKIKENTLSAQYGFLFDKMKKKGLIHDTVQKTYFHGWLVEEYDVSIGNAKLSANYSADRYQEGYDNVVFAIKTKYNQPH